jgi:hypothetical protein
MNAEYRRLKAQAARGQFDQSRTPKHRKGRSKQKKRVFDPRHVNDDVDDSRVDDSISPAIALKSNDEDDLPPNWEKFFDEAEQISYYYNSVTDETVWETPTM